MAFTRDCSSPARSAATHPQIIAPRTTTPPLLCSTTRKFSVVESSRSHHECLLQALKGEKASSFVNLQLFSVMARPIPSSNCCH
ncbi:hypothetical protein Bca101_043738 [Brassica carinata]